MWEIIKAKINTINWSVRLSNPTYIAEVVLAVAAPVFAYYNVTGADITTWMSLLTLICSALSNPYVFATILISLYNATVDPTTPGTADSATALTYTTPGVSAETATED